MQTVGLYYQSLTLQPSQSSRKSKEIWEKLIRIDLNPIISRNYTLYQEIQDGSVGKVDCYKAWQTEFNTWKPWHANTHTYTHTLKAFRNHTLKHQWAKIK